MRVNNATPTPTPPQPPPLQMDTAIFQAVVSPVVAATIAQINTNGASGLGSSTNNINQGDSQGHPRECSYKDFTNCKRNSFNGTGGVLALTGWFEKTESVFEICACLETSKVKFAA